MLGLPDLGPWIPVLLTSSLLLMPLALRKRPCAKLDRTKKGQPIG